MLVAAGVLYLPLHFILRLLIVVVVMIVLSILILLLISFLSFQLLSEFLSRAVYCSDEVRDRLVLVLFLSVSSSILT